MSTLESEDFDAEMFEGKRNHLEVFCDAGVVVVLQRREEAGPHDVGLGQPRQGRGHSQLGVEKNIICWI